MKSEWATSDAEAVVARYPDIARDLALRVYTTRLLGRNAKLVLHGGGNTSVKTKMRDLAGDEVEVLCIKGTGGNMGGTIADQMPTAIGGLPESAPQRPATPAAYPAVHNMPPPRASTVLTDQEQKKLEDELVAARNRAAATTAKPAGDTGSP